MAYFRSLNEESTSGKMSLLCVMILILVPAGVLGQLTYWQGTRSVLDTYGEIIIVRGLIRTQLITDQGVIIWNYTAYVDSDCTELANHVISPTGNNSNSKEYKWQGELVGGDSSGSHINAIMHYIPYLGFFGAGDFIAPGPFVVPFGVQWTTGTNDYFGLTFVDTDTAAPNGISVDLIEQTDKYTYTVIKNSLNKCSNLMT